MVIGWQGKEYRGGLLQIGTGGNKNEIRHNYLKDRDNIYLKGQTLGGKLYNVFFFQIYNFSVISHTAE